MHFGLRTRVALAFGLLSLLIAGVVSVATYGLARWYLLEQRESAALSRAVLDSRAVAASLDSGSLPSTALEQVPSVGTSQPMVLTNGVWYTTSVTVPPNELPQDLLVASAGGGAQQRAEINGEPYFLVAVDLQGATYVEVFPLRDLDLILTIGGWLFVIQTLLAGALGVLIGRYTVGQLLRPLRRLREGAESVAGGDFAARITLANDPDLDPLADSFNEMAQAVASRIQRERRFSANVSHELRSPLTSVVGTAELLDRRREILPDREAGLVRVLVEQVHRMSQMLLDLLEISRIGGDENLQWESVDLSMLCHDVVRVRGLSEHLVTGDSPIVRTDARRFERIVGNLIDNAQRHGTGVEQVLIQRHPESVHVCVDDAGPGVNPASLERLLEPFTRGEEAALVERGTNVSGKDVTNSASLDGRSSGAGLGLAIAAEQANLLGARLHVMASPYGGSRFVIEIPVRGGADLEPDA
ncbi:MAG: HAMP domain-containing histidine kinase [Candidatus Nanopelagicales bacterium]|jgi:two-component system, OmpR family, sensor histidine kinase MtrB|nr:HAMP domain-containing histidine kinase [Candidatus Nanopelagicales bacterium]